MVIIQQEDFEVQALYDQLRWQSSSAGAVSSGAIVTFTGLVRDYNDSGSLESMYLEHYPGMTEKEIDSIIDEARQKWQIENALVVHRVGELQPNEQIVFVGVSSRHRKESFLACSFIMDFLKVKATIWKKETDKTGTRWVEAKATDVSAAEDWSG